MTVPNYKPGAGRLVTDRYDFEGHIDGYSFKHAAKHILLSPAVTVGSSQTNLQDAIEALASLSAATIPDASTSQKGIVRLIGDISGSAEAVQVVGLRNAPIKSTPPINNYVLTYTTTGGAGWEAKPNPILLNADSVSLGIIRLAGDLGGSGSTASNPRVGAINSATVPAAGSLTTGHILKVSGSASLTYGFIGNTNIIAGAAIDGNKINPVFSNVAFISIGPVPAASGPGVRLTSGANTGVHTKDNISGSTDVSLIKLDSNNSVVVGNTSTNTILSGSVTQQVNLVNTSIFTVDSSNKNAVLMVDTSSTTVLIILPSPLEGRNIKIKDISGNASVNNISLAPTGATGIDGISADYVMDANFQAIELVSYNNGWWIVSGA